MSRILNKMIQKYNLLVPIFLAVCCGKLFVNCNTVTSSPEKSPSVHVTSPPLYWFEIAGSEKMVCKKQLAKLYDDIRDSGWEKEDDCNPDNMEFTVDSLINAALSKSKLSASDILARSYLTGMEEKKCNEGLKAELLSVIWKAYRRC